MHHEVAPLTARLHINFFYSPLNKVGPTLHISNIFSMYVILFNEEHRPILLVRLILLPSLSRKWQRKVLYDCWPDGTTRKFGPTFLYVTLELREKCTALAQTVASLPLVQRVWSSIPGVFKIFITKIINLGARKGGNLQLLIATL